MGVIRAWTRLRTSMVLNSDAATRLLLGLLVVGCSSRQLYYGPKRPLSTNNLHPLRVDKPDRLRPLQPDGRATSRKRVPSIGHLVGRDVRVGIEPRAAVLQRPSYGSVAPDAHPNGRPAPLSS